MNEQSPITGNVIRTRARKTRKRPKEVVSYNMSRIRSKNTRLERKLEMILDKTGLRFEKYYAVEGKPDFALPELKIALFADSNFWHGYSWKEAKKVIRTNRDFWIKKIERNIERDKEVNRMLRKSGWKVLRFWEHEISDDPEKCLKLILNAVKNRQKE